MPPDFARDVQRILADNCFTCHGPDENGRKAGLRLDVREAALKGGKSELRAIVPGKPAESELMLRITSSHENEIMPPRDTHKTISPAQIDILRRWIEHGADGQHWAFAPPSRPKLPMVNNAKWPRGALDRFVLERLERENLGPSPAADAAMFCRRLYLDLVGLPTTPQEVARKTARPSARTA